MWELDHKEGWALKNWCFWTVVLKTLESPLDYKEIQPVNLKGNQSWIFIGMTDAKAETRILWPLDAKSLLITKDPEKRPWEILKAGREENDRGWDGWMASPTRTWVWASCGRWWRTGKPHVLQSMGSQRVRHNWVAEQERKIQSESVKVSVAQSCPTLYETMGCSPPECSVHRFSQANTGVDCHSLLQGIFLTQRLNLRLLHCRFSTIWTTRKTQGTQASWKGKTGDERHTGGR